MPALTPPDSASTQRRPQRAPPLQASSATWGVISSSTASWRLFCCSGRSPLSRRAAAGGIARQLRAGGEGSGMRLPIGRRAVRRLQVLEIGRDDLTFVLGLCTGLFVILFGDGLVYGWGRRTLFDGQVIPLLQVPPVDHPLVLQRS